MRWRQRLPVRENVNSPFLFIIAILILKLIFSGFRKIILILPSVVKLRIAIILHQFGINDDRTIRRGHGRHCDD